MNGRARGVFDKLILIALCSESNTQLMGSSAFALDEQLLCKAASLARIDGITPGNLPHDRGSGSTSDTAACRSRRYWQPASQRLGAPNLPQKRWPTTIQTCATSYQAYMNVAD